jgi:hypothetical protein
LRDPAAAQSGAVFDAGVGAVDAANAWFCAWVFEWDNYRILDPVRASLALETLSEAYPEGLFWQSLAEPDGAGLKHEIDEASLGNAEALTAEIGAFGCRQ